MLHRRFIKTASLAAALLSLLSTAVQAQTVRYVKPDGNDANNGLSWANAKAAIGSALAASSSGDSVWAAGDDTTPYLEQIEIPAGVKAYGGFEGGETSLGQRNFEENDTTIHADGEEYAVTFDETSGTTTRLETFVVTGATGTAVRVVGDQSNHPTPTIEGCIVRLNEGVSGAALYIEGASPNIKSCQFRNNDSTH